MPEIKRTFTAGKMNKDLDERLVRNGEYRDALNIQVRTTDGDSAGIGNSGSVQNIEGNNKLDVPTYKTIGYNLEASHPQDGNNTNITRFIGSIADEKSDKAYFFAAAPLPHPSAKGIKHEEIMNYQVPESQYPPEAYLNAQGIELDDFDPNNIYEHALIQGPTPKIWVDSIMEVDAIAEAVEPIFVDKFMVTGRWIDIIGTQGPLELDTPMSPGFTQLQVLDGSLFRIGMKAYLQNDPEGLHFFQNAAGQAGVEIVDIQGNLLTLETSIDDYGMIEWSWAVGDLSWQSAITFRHEKALEFNYYKLISAINIVDDLLLWTDGDNEPKKINITRCKAGTVGPNRTTFPYQTPESYIQTPRHTQLMVSDPADNTATYPDDLVPVTGGNPNIEPSLLTADILKDHITVIRKAPVSPPTLYMSDTDRDGLVDFEIEYDFVQENENPVVPVVGSIRVITIPDNVDIRLNDVIIFQDTVNLYSPVVLRAKVIEFDENTNQATLEMMFIDIELQELRPTYWSVKLEQKKALFETKFGRVGYRYRYEDGEYSTYSPWSELAFLPGPFSYTASSAYNDGMINNVRYLVIKDFIPDDTVRPSDVKSIDILWKTTDDQNIYIVKTITRQIDSEWENFTDPGFDPDNPLQQENTGSLAITSEMIHRVIPNNQLYRGWDNVPKKAVAQEITANRLVYGNYTQGYDIKKVVGLEQSVVSNQVAFPYPRKSVKSIRNYKFGMVFGDRYGRETPVIANGINYAGESITGDISVEKSLASFANKFKVKQNWTGPLNWMEYVKYYVKETSNEYYNLVMDRWYDAGDGNIWLAFPSADRNKVDEQTYLILKNEHGSHKPVLEEARYKIIAIENEAPDFIKTDHRIFSRILIDRKGVYGQEDNEQVQNGIPDGLINNRKILTAKDFWIPDAEVMDEQDLNNQSFEGIKMLRIVGEFIPPGGDPDNPIEAYSPWKKVSRIKGTGSRRGAMMTEVFTEEEVNMHTKMSVLADDPISILLVDDFGGSGDGGGEAGDEHLIRYYFEFKDLVVENKPQFDGRFFVKILKDDIIGKYLVKESPKGDIYQISKVFNVGYIANWDSNPGFPNENNSMQPELLGPYNDPSEDGNGQFGWPWPSEDSVFTPDGAGNTPEIDGWNTYNTLNGAIQPLVPNFGVNPSYDEDTKNFWYWWYNKGFIGQDGSPPERTTSIFIDSAPCHSGYNFERRQGYTESVDFQTGAEAVSTLPGGEITVDGVTYTQNPNDVYEYLGGLQFFGSGDNPLYSDNWMPAGFAWGACENGEYGQVTFSNVGPGAGPGFTPGPDTEFKVLMQNPGTVFRFAQDPDQIKYQVISIEEEGYTKVPRTYTFNVEHGTQSNEYPHASISGSTTLEMTFDDWVDAFPLSSYEENADGFADSDVVGVAIIDTFNPWGDTGWSFKVKKTRMVNVAPIQGEISIWNANNFMWASEEDDPDFLRKRHSIITRFARVDTNGNIIPGTGINLKRWDPRGEVKHNGMGHLSIEILSEVDSAGLLVDSVATDAAVWETEPKEEIDVDIYYEASGVVPLILKNKNIKIFTDPSYLKENACEWAIDPRGINTNPQLWDGMPEFDDVAGSLPGRRWVFETYGHDAVRLVHGDDYIQDMTTQVNNFSAFGISMPTSPYSQQFVNGNYFGEINYNGNTNGDILQFKHKNGLITRSQVLDHYKLKKYGNQILDPGEDYDPVDVPVLSDRVTLNGGESYFNFTQFGLIPSILYDWGYYQNFEDDITVGMQVIGDGVLPGTFVVNIVNPFSPQVGSPYVQLNKPVVQGVFNGRATYVEVTGLFRIDRNVWKYPVELGWYNCYSFGNALESDRIRDDFNAPQIDNGIRASSTFLEYSEERMTNSLIHSSELYNSISSVNGLNQFNMGEKITKNLNPVYGSIQALKTRDTNLVTFCEDKVLKVLANKDAVFNADGNTNLTATNKVLGQTIPFAGDYGISKNPESLAIDQYRLYFTDKQRGAVLRLSGDGLTPISNVGMKAWFREYLRMCDNIVGTFDVVNGEYNIKLGINEVYQTEQICTPSGCSKPATPLTLSFNEGSKSWVSFKSFVHSCGVSVSGKYITAPGTFHKPPSSPGDAGIPEVEADSPLVHVWIHNSDAVGRNNFYSKSNVSSIDIMFNDMPDVIKSFKTVNYEGSRAFVTQYTDYPENWDGEFYNTIGSPGWSVKSITTDLQTGYVPEFINKENKFFNYIHGDTIGVNNLDNRSGELAVQGIAFPLLIGPTPDANATAPENTQPSTTPTTTPTPTPTPTQTDAEINVDLTPVPTSMTIQTNNFGPGLSYQNSQVIAINNGDIPLDSVTYSWVGYDEDGVLVTTDTYPGTFTPNSIETGTVPQGTYTCTITDINGSTYSQTAST